MRNRFAGAPRRISGTLAGAGLACLLGLWILAAPLAGALAHDGHDHGAPPPAAAAPATPRVALQSDAYELVGVLKGDRLAVYLDRYATNEPVRDARIAVTLGGDEEVAAEPRPDGTFAVASARLAGEGPLELVFAITAKGGDDLLIGTLDLPRKAVAAPPAPSPARLSALEALGSVPAVRVRGVEIPQPALIAGVALALGFVLGLTVRGGRRLVPAAGLALLVLAVSASYARAHEGHDHGDAGRAAMPAGDAPRRLSDGTVFLPKPSQRLLEVRTTLTKPEAAQRAVSLVGRVVADPNRGGVVQSLSGGRVLPSERGLPRIGQRVRRGDVLALIEPAVAQADRTTISERAGEIEQGIAVAETKLRRLRTLAERGIVPQSQVVDAETELEGLRKRREIVRQTRVEPEVLRASADGVIAAAKVVAGQVVSAQDVLFQIVDPAGLWVEALTFGEADPTRLAEASAVAPDGTTVKLAFQGFSRALQQQATVVQFAVETPPPTLAIGQPLTVLARSGEPVRGLILPRDAVVRGGNGEAVVWRHTDPERFEARPVRTEAFDATRLIVRAGLEPGERIVTRGAELINQIR